LAAGFLLDESPEPELFESPDPDPELFESPEPELEPEPSELFDDDDDDESLLELDSELEPLPLDSDSFESLAAERFEEEFRLSVL
jgi:hypothetical protein